MNWWDADPVAQPAAKLGNFWEGDARVSPPKPVGAAMSVNNPPTMIGPGPRTSHSPNASPSWGQVAGDFVTNLPRSLRDDVIVPTYEALRYRPVETAKSVLDVLAGVSEILPQPRMTEEARRERNALAAKYPVREAREARSKAAAAAVWQDFVDAYGSEEALKNTLANHPGRFVMDASTLGTAGGAAPGRVVQVVARAGAVIDPLTQTGNVIKGAGKLTDVAGSNVLGMTTGAGSESIRAAGRAGREGGATGKAFTDNMRGNVPIEDIVVLAKSGLEEIRKDRAAAYKAGKADLSKDATVLDFTNIDASVAKASDVGEYRGRSGSGPAQTTEPKAVAITQEMTDSINAWKQLDPAEFHTPEGLDALKRRLGNIRDSTQQGSPDRVAADRIYRAVRDEVAAQAPGYAKMMEDYSVASDKIKEVTKTFSLGEKATGDTAARKLQSATRDGAQTSWRKRGELLNELATYEPDLPYAIAGQSLNALAPRGLVARAGSMYAGGSAIAGLLANPLSALPTIASLPAFSPRIIGEVVYLGGKAVGSVDQVAKVLGITPARLRAGELGAYQAGRNEETTGNALRVQ